MNRYKLIDRKKNKVYTYSTFSWNFRMYLMLALGFVLGAIIFGL